MKRIAGILLMLVYGMELTAQKPDALSRQMTVAARDFLASLTGPQRLQAVQPYDSPLRFDWNYTPRNRKGITLKELSVPQRQKALKLLQTVLSTPGYSKATQIIDLENVLRVVEKRPANDTYRDPENYAFLIFGEPGTDTWGWRMEGHHLSLHFSAIDNQISFLPGFMGSNPAEVQAAVPQQGRRVLKEEIALAFALLESLDEQQRQQAVLRPDAPNDIFTRNARKALLEQQEGLPLAAMTPEQQTLFRQLIEVYLHRYHVTLKKQQWTQLEAKGIEAIRFAWMGDTRAEFGTGLGHYYRIHGPSILIEFDNTQNGGNHIHSVVRDLENDFGEDLLRQHYERVHLKKH